MEEEVRRGSMAKGVGGKGTHANEGPEGAEAREATPSHDELLQPESDFGEESKVARVVREVELVGEEEWG